MTRGAVIAGLAAVLGGCAAESPSERDRRPPVWATARVAAASTATAAVPTATAAPILHERLPIDLPTALRLAGEQANRIALVRARADEADAAVTTAAGRLLPSFAAGGVFSRHEGRVQDTGGKFLDVDRQRLFLGTTAELTLDPAGGIYGLLAARRRARASESALAAVTNDVALEAAERYFDLVLAQATVRIAEEAVAHAGAFLGIAETRERQQLGLRVDTLRARARLADTQHDLIRAGEAARLASTRLATLLRIEPTVTLFTAEPVMRQVTLIDAGTPVDRLIAEALERRPEVRELLDLAGAARTEHEAATYGPLLPSLRAGNAGPGGVLGPFGGLGVEGTSPGDLRGREDWWVGLEWRLDGLGFGAWGRAREAEARERAAEVRSRDLEDRIRAEVIEAREGIASRAAEVEAGERELAAAEESLAISQRRLEQGLGLALEVLEAQVTRARAGRRFVGAITGYNKAQYRLLARLGERPATR